MMRRVGLVFAFVCVLSMGAWSCQQAGSPSSPAPVSALSRFEPYLNAQLTPAIARARFGQPDEETGSGLRIYIYKLSDGRRLWLGFPGDAPIAYARIEDVNGTFTELPLVR